MLWCLLPKGPFRTKSAMALEAIVFYYCRNVLLSVSVCCHVPKENSIFRPFAEAKRCGRSDLLGDRQPRTIPTKDPSSSLGIWGGGVRIVGTEENSKIRTPSFALAMLIVDFVGVVRGFRGPNL